MLFSVEIKYKNKLYIVYRNITTFRTGIYSEVKYFHAYNNILMESNIYFSRIFKFVSFITNNGYIKLYNSEFDRNSIYSLVFKFQTKMIKKT